MSTIITDNPYSFTVEDNMSIKAVFENAAGVIKSIKSQGVVGTGYSGTCYVYLYSNTGSTIGSATFSYVSGGGFTMTSNTLNNKQFLDGYKISLVCTSMPSGAFNLGLKVRLYIKTGSSSGTTRYTLTCSSAVSTSRYFNAQNDVGQEYYLVCEVGT